MDNYLVPLDYNRGPVVLRATEALWPLINGKFQLRFTKKQVGVIFGASDPQHYINKLVERNPHLKQLGSEMEVISYIEDGCHGDTYPLKKISGLRHTYKVMTYDLDEIYFFAVESDLPGAKKYLRNYPQIKAAIAAHAIKPPAVGKIRPEVLEYLNVAYHEKKAYRVKVCAELGWLESKFYRKVEEAILMLNIPPAPTKLTRQPRKSRADRGKTAYPEKKQEAYEYWKEHRDIGRKALKKAQNLPVSVNQVGVWIRRWKEVTLNAKD